MVEDYFNSVFKNALDDYIKKMQNDGLTVEEILEKLSDDKINQTLQHFISLVSTDALSIIENSMYEKVLFERARAAEFMSRNEQVWWKGFAASEAMYIVVCEFAENYNAYLLEQMQEELKKYQFQYVALREIHGRSCQQFLEIIYLLKAGFADGAYARWRSLYELSVIGKFIRDQKSEEVARAYYDSVNNSQSEYNWAKAASCFSNATRIRFYDIRRKCNQSSKWEEQFKLSCQIVHASAGGTFGRLANGPNSPNIVPVGHSDFGLAMPAINSALSLALCSINFFGLFHYVDSIVYIKVVQEWAEKVRDYYTEIENKCFH